MQCESRRGTSHMGCTGGRTFEAIVKLRNIRRPINNVLGMCLRKRVLCKDAVRCREHYDAQCCSGQVLPVGLTSHSPVAAGCVVTKPHMAMISPKPSVSVSTLMRHYLLGRVYVSVSLPGTCISGASQPEKR
jgi:hypothetical protein